VSLSSSISQISADRAVAFRISAIVSPIPLSRRRTMVTAPEYAGTLGELDDYLRLAD
jgi:hypothetical protein